MKNIKKIANEILAYSIDSNYFHHEKFHGNLIERQQSVEKLFGLLERNDIRAKVGNSSNSEYKVLMIHENDFTRGLEIIKTYDKEAYNTLKEFYKGFRKKYNLK